MDFNITSEVEGEIGNEEYSSDYPSNDEEYELGSGLYDIDLELNPSTSCEQESPIDGNVNESTLTRHLPRHLARQLAAQEREAKAERQKLKPAKRRKDKSRSKTHRRLRIISGCASGKRILSPQGDQTRPMMELVRGAVFNMISSMHGMGASGNIPETTRWLDLFAGTGAVGIEALSRGCGEAHFVELSPWVVSNCLEPNLEHCEVLNGSIIHTSRVEDFLQRAIDMPRFAGGSFDFISVCPPYEMVSYTEVLQLLLDGPFLKETSIVVVEYPRKLTKEIPETLGPLTKLRDRRYGRTFVALYGPE